MADRRFVKGAGDYLRSFSTEGGANYRVESQNLNGAIKHVEKIRHMHEHATKASNPNEWRHLGSIPIVVITDWLTRNKYTFDQFARDEDNCKKKFLKYFMSRDFSKLHNGHVTTKRESSQIVVPNYIGGSKRDHDIRGTKN